MSKFAYTAKNPMGKNIKGSIEAVDARSVSSVLRKQGLFVINISPVFSNAIVSDITRRFSGGVDFSEITNFTRQLAVMISTGLTITEALAVLRNQAHKESMQQLLEKLIVTIEGGISLSKALAMHKYAFSDIYIAVVRAGESSGLLDKMLVRLADNLEREREFQGKTKGALLYPAIIMGGMGIVMTIMMIFVVPQLSSLYTQLSLDLPWPTKIIIAISNFFVAFWWLIPIAIAIGFLIFTRWSKTVAGKFTLDAFALKVPAWGKLQSFINLAELTRTFGLLIGSGTPIIDALQDVSQASRNVHFAFATGRIAKKVEKGVSLADAFSHEPIFPPIVSQMARVGEETGKLDEVILSISDYFEGEVDRRIKTLTTLLEPIMLVILGVGVGFLIISVILPIYSLTQAF